MGGSKMDSTVVYTLVGLVGMSVVLTILVQMFKDQLPTREDAEGREIGPRRWLAPIVLAIGAVLGGAIGAIRGDYKLPDGAAWMAAWVFAGFINGAASAGYYGGLKALFPGVFSDSGWLGRSGKER